MTEESDPDVVELRGEVAVVKTKVTTLDNKVTTQGRDITEILKEVRSLTDMNGPIAGLRQEVVVLSSEVDEVQEKVADHLKDAKENSDTQHQNISEGKIGFSAKWMIGGAVFLVAVGAAMGRPGFEWVVKVLAKIFG